MIESPRKQIFEGAGAKDMELVTTRQGQKAAENRQNKNLNAVRSEPCCPLRP
ncbi:MAG: hypothetical protein IKS39_07635 [Clostridia bacterium]|nr:hypothetical protein [Clostridia bacterium]